MTMSAAGRSAALSMAGALALLLSAELHGAGPQQPASGAGSQQPVPGAGPQQPASGAGSQQPASDAGPQQPASGAAAAQSPQRALLDRYCVTCHNETLRTAGLTLDLLDVDDVAARPEVWEKVVRKLRAGLMPPMGRPRPDREAYDGFAGWLEARLDLAAALDPHPGRSPVFHRLNRAEYANAIRDLLAVEIDATELLPADDASYGFDNIAASLRMSPTLVDRYLAAARKISRTAVGSSAAPPAVEVYHLPPDLPQERHLARRPLAGTPPRGAAAGHARRHAGPAPLPEGRRVRHSGQAGPRHRGQHSALRRDARAGDPARRRAGRAVHVRRRAGSR